MTEEIKYSLFRPEKDDLIVVRFNQNKISLAELSVIVKQIEKNFEGRNKVIVLPVDTNIERMDKASLHAWLLYAERFLGQETEVESNDGE